MKTFLTILSMVLFLGHGLIDSSAAAQAGGSAGEKKTEQSKSPLFAYKPPMRGKPGNRVGGGTRGFDRDTPVIAALVPDHTGLTTKGQPVLYWYLSAPTGHDIEFTLINEQSVEPLIEVNLKKGSKGIHPVRLSDYRIDLLKGVEYQWYVAVVRDPEQRSKDIIATGTIKRVDPTDSLGGSLAKAGPEEIPYVYADNGIWYDTLAALSELIDKNPAEERFIKLRAALLEQAGLSEVVKE